VTAEPTPLAGIPLTVHVDPPRLQALPLPDGRFALIVSGCGLPGDDFDTLRRLADEVGAAAVAVFVGQVEAG